MTRVGNVYGEALYALALEDGLSERILEELNVLDRCFREHPEFIRLLASPNISKQERCGVLNECFRGNVQPYVLNFLKILTEKGYIKHFPDCCAAYQQRYNQDKGILPVTAVTAVALSKKQTKKLTSKLSHITGKQVTLQNRIDPAVLGGVRLIWEGHQLDGTLSYRLDALGKTLKNTVLS